MNACMIQESGAELKSEDTSCVSAEPLGAFVIVVSDTQVLLDIKGTQWQLPIGTLVQLIKNHGVKIQ